VTTLALGRFVFAFQRVLGVLVMVEAGLLPALFVMAGFALLAQAALVALLVIVLAMTGNTLGRQLVGK